MNVTVMSRWDAVFYCYNPHRAAVGALHEAPGSREQSFCHIPAQTHQLQPCRPERSASVRSRRILAPIYEKPPCSILPRPRRAVREVVEYTRNMI